MNENFKIINSDGKEIICKILFTYKDEKTNKNYVTYTDGTKDTNGSLIAYGAIYHPEDLMKPLEPITTSGEWKRLSVILESIQNNISN